MKIIAITTIIVHGHGDIGCRKHVINSDSESVYLSYIASLENVCDDVLS